MAQLKMDFRKPRKKTTAKKKTVTAAKKRTTRTTVKAELKSKGYRLPHGYEVVKIKPKKATKSRVVKRKTTSKTK